MSWVVEDAPDLPPHLLPTLVGLANHADEHGRGAYPAQELIAEYARKSDRAVRNDLEALMRIGLIRHGDQNLTGHLPVDRRPVVYDLAVERKRERKNDRKPTSGRSRKPRSEENDRKPASARKSTSARNDAEGQKPRSDDRKQASPRSTEKNDRKSSTGTGGSGLPTNRPYEPSLFVLQEQTPAPEPPRDLFEDFYAAYPRKAAKGRARREWAAALKRGKTGAELIDIATRYAAHTKHCQTDQKWIPYASSWLKDERYDDYIPEPTADRPHLQAVSGDWRPYQNPTDPDAYDGDL